MLLARAARAGIIASDLRTGAHERLAGMLVVMTVIVSMIAVRAVYVALMSMLGEDGVGLGGQVFALVHLSRSL